jgi:hypothetical protein
LKKTIALFIILIFFLPKYSQAGSISLTVRALNCSDNLKRPLASAEFYAHFFNPCRGEEDFFHRYLNDFGEVSFTLPLVAVGETLIWSISSPPDYETSFGSYLFSRPGGHYLEVCLKKKSSELPKPPTVIIKKATPWWEVTAVLGFCAGAYLIYAKKVQH